MAAELTTDESAAVQKALTSYLSDLRMEIANTDNAEYRRGLQAERTSLEAALAKLDASGGGAADASSDVVTISLVWMPLPR